MTKTLRGGNSPLSVKLARRERVAFEEHLAPPEAEELGEEETSDSEASGPQEVTDAQKAALNEFTVVQLRERLKSIGLPVSGTKSELIKRLLTAKED